MPRLPDISNVWNSSKRLNGSLDGFIGRHPRLSGCVVRYGFVVFIVLAVVMFVSGAAVPQGRGQEVVYATGEGDIVSMSPVSGEKTLVFSASEGGYAVAPSFGGGSRSLSFTVLRGRGEDFRGDLYGADLVRGTKASLQGASGGEVFLNGGYSSDREWMISSRYSADSPPNVAVSSASAAETLYVEPLSDATSALLGPSWMARNSLYAWRDADGQPLSLTAYDYFERRQVVVYETERRVGEPSYDFESNTLVFDERDIGASLEDSTLTAIIGTTQYSVEGADGLGLYDPSIPVPELDYRMAVVWTDGRKSGVGLFDPATRTFEKTAVEVESGSHRPQISYDGNFVATTNETGDTLTIHSMDDGEIVRRIEGVQPQGEVFDRMSSLDVPREAVWFAPDNYGWRSVADS